MTLKMTLKATARSIAVAVALLAAPALVLAHSPKVGANGGAQVDAGVFHLDLRLGLADLAEHRAQIDRAVLVGDNRDLGHRPVGGGLGRPVRSMGRRLNEVGNRSGL